MRDVRGYTGRMPSEFRVATSRAQPLAMALLDVRETIASFVCVLSGFSIEPGATPKRGLSVSSAHDEARSNEFGRGTQNEGCRAKHIPGFA